MVYTLSETMCEVLETMKKHNGKLIRWKHGFWTYEDCISRYDETIAKWPNFYDDAKANPHSVFANNMELAKSAPIWWCDVKTLRALQIRGLVTLDEVKEVCILVEPVV